MNVAIASIGHNKPPGPLEAGYDTMRALSDWMGECPVIENEDHAREAKRLLDRAKGAASIQIPCQPQRCSVVNAHPNQYCHHPPYTVLKNHPIGGNRLDLVRFNQSRSHV